MDCRAVPLNKLSVISKTCFSLLIISLSIYAEPPNMPPVKRTLAVDAIHAGVQSKSTLTKQKSVWRHSKIIPITAYFAENPEMYFTRLVVDGIPQLASVVQNLGILHYELLHRTIRISDILKQTNALESFFSIKGLKDIHILAGVGGKGKDRTLYLTVIRGEVTTLRKAGNYGYQTYITRYYNHEMGQLPDYDQRYYYSALANQITDMTTDTYMLPTNVPGTYNFYTLNHLKRFGGFIGMNNTGIQPLGHMIYSATGYVNGIFGNDQLESGGSFTSKTNKGQFFYATYRMGVGTHGTQLLGSFAYSQMQIGETIIYKFLGRGKSFSLEVMQPVYITTKTFLRMIAGYALQRGKTQGGVFNAPVVTALEFRNSIVKETIPTIYTDFAFSHLYSMGRIWGQAGVTFWGHFLVDNKYSAVGGVIQGDTADPNVANPLSQNPRMTGQKFNFSYNQLVMLSHDFSIYLGSHGQVAFDSRMPLGMLFGFFDGAFLGQGYVANSGVSGHGELRWDWNIFNPYFKDIQFFGFYALAYMESRDPLYTSYSRAVPMTSGFGFRAHFLEKMDGFVEFAKPIRRKTSYDNKSAWRFFFGIGVNV
jgi:hypothetical protein